MKLTLLVVLLFSLGPAFAYQKDGCPCYDKPYFPNCICSKK